MNEFNIYIFQDFELTLATLEHIGAIVKEDNHIVIDKSTNKTIVFLARMFEPFLLGYWVSVLCVITTSDISLVGYFSFIFESQKNFEESKDPAIQPKLVP